MKTYTVDESEVQSRSVRRAIHGMRDYLDGRIRNTRFAVVALALIALAAGYMARDAQGGVGSVQNAVTPLQTAVATLEGSNKKLGGEIKDLQRDLSETNRRIDDFQKELTPASVIVQVGQPGETATPTPTSTATPIPSRYELEVFADEWNLGSFEAEFTYPIEDEDKELLALFIDSGGGIWPNRVSNVYGEYSGRPSVTARGECYMPWGDYTVQVALDGKVVQEAEYKFSPPEPLLGRIEVAPIESHPAITKTNEGWEFKGIGSVREDTYLIKITPEDDEYEVTIVNLDTSESITVRTNEYELVGIDLLYFYYNEQGEAVDGGWGSVTIWPAGQAVVTEGALYSSSKGVTARCDDGTFYANEYNLLRYFEPYQLPDGTWVTLDMVDQGAYERLMEDRTCPAKDYQAEEEAPTPTPTPTLAPTATPIPTREPEKPPVSLDKAPFDKVSKVEAPASYLTVGASSLVISGRGDIPLATCSEADSAAIAAVIENQGENTIVVWLWDGYAHSFETIGGDLILAACEEWRPPEAE